MMHLSTLLSLTATALLTSAKPQFIPPVVATALAVAPVPSAVAAVVGSAVAAVPAAANNASADSIPSLNIPPDQLSDNIFAVIAILGVVLNLLNSAGFADTDVQSVKVGNIGNVDLPISAMSDFSGLGYNVTALIDLCTPLLSTDSA